MHRHGRSIHGGKMNRDQYDRVTSILAPFSGIDKVPDHILESAAHRGTRVHALCEGLIRGVDIEEAEDYQLYKGYIDSFRQWKEGKNFLTHPGRLYCDKKEITGECDGIFKSHGKEFIFDLKTSVSESKTWKLQAASYAYLNENVQGDVYFIKLSKEGKKPVEYIYESSQHIQTFWKCLDLYRIFFKTKKPIDEENL